MKLHDVLEVLIFNQEYRFRPISWKGRGEAYCLRNGCTTLVPTANGGINSMTYYAKELKEDWEILTPTAVLDERY